MGRHPMRPLVLAETGANLAAYLTSAIVGLQLGSLPLLAASAHPLATVGFRGLPWWRRRSTPLAGIAIPRRRRLWFCIAMLVCAGLPFAGFFLTDGAHNFFRSRRGEGTLLTQCALGIVLATSLSLLRTYSERPSSFRADALLAFASACICLASAIAAIRTNLWLQDGVHAILLIGAWEARILLWVLERLFSK